MHAHVHPETECMCFVTVHLVWTSLSLSLSLSIYICVCVYSTDRLGLSPLRCHKIVDYAIIPCRYFNIIGHINATAEWKNGNDGTNKRWATMQKGRSIMHTFTIACQWLTFLLTLRLKIALVTLVFHTLIGDNYYQYHYVIIIIYCYYFIVIVIIIIIITTICFYY